MTKIYYIAEITLPNTSAQAQHVLKMCDNFSNHYNTKLILLYKKRKYFFKKIKYDFFLKNVFEIIPFYKNLKFINFFDRIKFALFACKNIEKHCLIITRSPIVSFLLAIKGYTHFLEIHHELKGFSNFFFFFIKKTSKINNIYFIFTHKNLIKILDINKNFLILDDAVDIEDFKIKKNKVNTIYDCTYIGSFYKGRGLEVIDYLSKKFEKLNFHLFGDLNTLSSEYKNYFSNNVIFHNFVPYRKVIKVISRSKILLMPYLNSIHVRSKNLDTSKTMSPMKMFQYLASKRIFIASKLKVYSHILKNEFNCLLASPNNFSDWKTKMEYIINNEVNIKRITQNAKKTANIYTWNKRVKKIIEKYNSINATID
jgi:glycosyltransferase involved in cell wall biosynthesis